MGQLRPPPLFKCSYYPIIGGAPSDRMNSLHQHSLQENLHKHSLHDQSLHDQEENLHKHSLHEQFSNDQRSPSGKVFIKIEVSFCLSETYLCRRDVLIPI